MRGSVSHRVAHGGLQGGVLLGLAADVIENEEQVVVIRKVGGNLHLYLLVELRGPAKRDDDGKHRNEGKLRNNETRSYNKSSYLLW